MAIRAFVTVTKPTNVVSSVKTEAVTSHQRVSVVSFTTRAEAIASRNDDSINQWFYEAIPLSELVVTSFTKSLTETLSISEAPVLGLGMAKSETLNMLESFAKVVTFNRSFTDAFTLDDAAQVEKDYYGNKGNVAFMLDVLGISLNRPATDSYTVGDVYTAAVNKIVAENVSLIESQVRSFNLGKSDSLPITESINVAPELIKTDSFSFTDAQYASLSKIVNDSMTITEVVGFGIDRPITESFSVSDSIISEINKVIADAFTLDDSAIIEGLTFNKGNICTVSDVIALAITWVRSYSDSISTSDSANIANISGRVLNGASFNRITLN
jgi:hypothetical protein